jgi:nicotinate-nucleotide adenylyltransferase
VARIGILGGTFNPPHLGHLALARSARDELQLDRVALIPTHSAPHKPDELDPGPEHRLAMCRLLVADEEATSACALEIERGGVSYTVESLRALHAAHPDAQLTFVVGADVAGTIGSWRDPCAVLQLARLAVAARAGAARRRVLAAVDALDASADVRFLAMPAIDISSSMVRRRVMWGEPIERLVGPAVAGYIAEHGLYHADGEARG